MSGLSRATAAPHVRGSLPGIGSAIDLFRDPYGWWPRQYAVYGPVFRMTLPIEGRTWIVIGGRDANALLAKEGQRVFSQKMTYPKASQVLATELHPSFTEGGLQHHLRRQVAPGFSRQAAAPHLGTMAARVREYVEQWKPGQTLNVTRATARMGLDCVAIFATGAALAMDSEAIRRYATVFTGVVATSWPMALLRWPSVRGAREGLDRMIEGTLAHHRRVPPGDARPPDYFDFVLRGTLPDDAPLPERVRVVFGQIPFKNMGVYAGRVINHVLYELVSRPDVLARVQPEIDRALADGEITLEEIAGMHATRAAIAETLRLRPIAATLQRTVCEPFEFGGYRFEVGDRVFTAISLTHFLHEFFPEPARFDLDRFAPERSEHLQHFVYNPFGLGHHACVARGVFEAITTVVVGTVLHRWRLDAGYRLRTIVDALPGPWTRHTMRVVEARRAAPSVAGRRYTPSRAVSLPGGLLRLLDASPVVELAEGEVLFREGDPADRVCFVTEGSLRITKRVGGAAPALVASLGPGDVVGEIGILHGVPRTATATAAGTTRLLAIDGDSFLRIVVEEDVTARELGDVALRRHAGTVLATLLSSAHAADRVRAGTLASRAAAPGETIIRRGDPATHFWLLVEGGVDVVVERPSGEVLTLARLHAPDCFGEIAMLQARPRSATVRVSPEGPARLISLDREAFDALVLDPEAKQALSLIAARRDRQELH
jgi:cytochrome P450/CRP-like cAMP-binding protein